MAKKAAASMDRFFGLSGDLFLVAGVDGSFQFVNGAWKQVIGYAPEELLGKPYLDFVHPDDRDRTRAEAAKIAAGYETTAFENRYIRKNGSIVWLNWNARSAADEQVLYCVARDVTERKRTEEELRAAQAQMERGIEERTAELARTNAVLQAEIVEREHAEAELRKQQNIAREFSTPVLPVAEGLLIVPMVGAVDPSRARQLTEQLLRDVRSYRAKVAVIDVTGVATIDTAIANHLIQTAQACNLLGAKVIITGISRDIALTLVQLGVDLTPITTKVDLRSGIEEAHQILGLQLVRRESNEGKGGAAEHQGRTEAAESRAASPRRAARSSVRNAAQTERSFGR